MENKHLGSTFSLEEEHEKLAAEFEEALEVIKFYAHPVKYSDQEPGMVLEFGCGCCAGIVDEDGTVSYDNSVQGAKARDFLAKVKGEG